MKNKWLWALFIVLFVEAIALGYYFLQKSPNTPTTDISLVSEHVQETQTTNTSTDLSIESQDIDTSHWLTSEDEIKFPILMYHSLTESEGNTLKVPPHEFKEHLTWLKEEDYYMLTPEEAYLVLTENKKPAEKIVWVTLDDGYLNNYTEGFPILKELMSHATINYITSKLGSDSYFSLDNMKEMDRSSEVSIESHTVSHLDLNTLSDEQITSELKESKEWLESELDKTISVLCYPAGRYDERVERIAEETGYQMALTTEPGLASASDGLYALKRVRVEPGMDKEAFGYYLSSYY